MDEPRLFELPHDELHAHVTWKADVGWSLWVNSWERHEGPSSGRSEWYERLTLAECLDTLEAVVRGRLGLW